MDIVLEPQRNASIEQYEDSDKANNNKIKELLNTNRPVLVIVYLFSIFRFKVHNNEVVPNTKKMKLLCILLLSFYVSLYCTFIRLPSPIGGTTKFVDMAKEIPVTVKLIRYAVSAIRTSFYLNQENIRFLQHWQTLMLSYM